MKRAIRWILIVICAAVFCYAGYMLLSTLLEYQKADNFYDATANQFVSPVPPAVTEQKDTSDALPELLPETGTAELPAVDEPEEPRDAAPIVVDFDSLLAVSDDVVGWLYCEDTVINYPVMQAEDNDYYLHRMLDGTYNYSGSLFMDYRCFADFSSGNTVIYGHNMKNGSMLHTLLNYAEQEYYDEHPVMYLLTPDQNYALHLFSAFITSADSWVYMFDFYEDGGKEAYIQQCLTNSKFEASFTPSAEDTLVTLSTCTYEYDDARYVVMGVLKPAD